MPLFPHIRRCAAPLLAAIAPCVQAQFIDDVEWRRDGDAAVLQVRFVTPVQYRRSLAGGDLLQVFYDVLPAPALPEAATSERRVGVAGLPNLVITDETAGRDPLARRLVVRFAAPTPARVRAGRDERTLEIVLDGRAAAVPAPAPALTQQPPATAQFQITLLQSDAPGLSLDLPIPAALQRYEVFTGVRHADGRLVHEISIGYFETEAEAEAARRVLLPRFPRAALVALGGAPAAVAVPPPPVAAAAPTPLAPVTAAPAVVAATPAPPAADLDARAAALLASAQQAEADNNHAAALAALNTLLDLPANASSRAAQALIGRVRLRAGETARARAEFEAFLKQYPSGADADSARAAIAAITAAAGTDTAPAQAPRQRAPVAPTTTLTGSLAAFYYGGASKVRTQEFQDSPISGLPELASDNTLSGTDQRQLLTSVDANWRHRDADSDMRFVFRDAYTRDLERRDKSRNRLSALYFEHRSQPLGTGLKIGRQSPAGGGVLGRFDGVQAGYAFLPKWRANVVAGQPADRLLDSKRHFYGAWIDAEALTPALSGSVYLNRQVIDGETDRDAWGAELRYFGGGLSLSAQVDQDRLIGGLNIASLQATWQSAGNTVVNLLYDRRATPILMLGNALFFGTGVPAPTADDPAATRPATSLKDLLDNGYTAPALRDAVKRSSATTSQGLFAVTTPVDEHWQIGADLRITNLGEIAPIPDVLPGGQGRSRNRSIGAQAIASNLYSARDTHVFGVSWLSGSGDNFLPPDGRLAYGYSGRLLSYNNASQLGAFWLVEPSLRYYAQSDKAGVKTTRWSPGLRVTYRAARQVAIESELSGERSRTSGPTRNEDASRVYYYLGGRYDF